MKHSALVFVGLVFLSGTVCPAMPALGDHAEYDVEVTTGGSSFSVVLIKDLIAFDALIGFTEKSTTVFNGTANSVEQKVPENGLNTDAMIAHLLSHCVQAKGNLEKVQTPLGILDTYAIPFNSGSSLGTTWFGNVTYGIVRQDQTNFSSGQHTIMTIKNFHNG